MERISSVSGCLLSRRERAPFGAAKGNNTPSWDTTRLPISCVQWMRPDSAARQIKMPMGEMEKSSPSQQTGETILPPVLLLNQIVCAGVVRVGARTATIGRLR